MFRLFLFLSLFFCFIPFSGQAKKTKIKKKVFNENKLELEKSVSLMELLNDTDQLKNEIKRDLAEKENQRSPSSKKKMVQFGNMKISISERKESEELKSAKQNENQAKRLKTEL